MFAFPREVTLTGLQAGILMRKTYKAGATKSQLEAVRKMLSFAWQLWRPLIETLQIGILATCIGSVLALPMGFLAARIHRSVPRMLLRLLPSRRLLHLPPRLSH